MQGSLSQLLSLRSLGEDPGLVQQRLSSQLTSSLALSSLVELDTSVVSHGVSCLDIDSEEGRYLVSGALDGSLYIHDTGARGSSEELALHISRSNKHCHTAYVTSVSWGQDTGIFLSSSRDGILKVWDTNEGRPADQFPVGVTTGGVNCHSPGRGDLAHIVAVASQTSSIRLVDLRAGSTSHQLQGHTSQVTCLAWSRGSPSILASGEGLGDGGRGGGKVILWDVRQAKSQLRSLDYNDVRGRARETGRLAGAAHQGRVLGLVFTGCGRYLVSVGKDARVRKWDLVTGKNTKTKFPKVETGHACTLPWSLDLACTVGGETDCVLVPEGSRILRLDLGTGRPGPPLEGHYGSVTALTYSEGHLQLFSGDRDKHILVWEPGGGSQAWREEEDRPGRGGEGGVGGMADSWTSEEED